VNAAIKNGYLTSKPNLVIKADPIMNAYASSGTTVTIYAALSELISDSESELASIIGHELGHIYQQRNGGLLSFGSNSEEDADIWGVLLAMKSGYDPYGIAGALGKLAMATGTAGLMTQWELDASNNVHPSINTRLENVYYSFSTACNSSADVKAICDAYKNKYHPHFPANAPLMKKGEDQ
jgi:predicted Zn-dependent protease